MTIAAPEAWVYARRSRKSQDQASVEDQQERGGDACRANGWRLAGTLAEEVSASRYARKQRDEWPLMLEKIRAGLVSVLILWSSSRGGRRLDEWAAFLSLCEERRVLLHILSDERTYDPANRADWEVLASQGVGNDAFSRRLSGEIARGKSKAMRKGRAQGAPPFGYRVRYNVRTSKTAGWEIVGEEAPVVREIITRIGRSEPARTIQKDLNARGIAAATGGQWVTSQVKHVARNPSYAGLLRMPDGGYVARQTQVDGAEWPAIVTREEWERARTVLESRMTGERPGGIKYLLSGMGECECGEPIRNNAQGAYVCPQGHNYINAEWLETRMRYVVCTRLAKDDARELFLADDGPEKARLRSEVMELTGRRSRFRKQAALGQISDDALAEIEQTLGPEITSREARLGQVSYVPAVAEAISSGDVFGWWDGATVQAKRAALGAVTGVVVRRMPKTAPQAERYGPGRLVLDGKPQQPRRGRITPSVPERAGNVFNVMENARNDRSSPLLTTPEDSSAVLITRDRSRQVPLDTAWNR